MATSKCPYCGRDVFGFEWSCPGCGKDIRGRAAESGADGSPPTPGRDKAVLVVVCPACDKSHKVPRHSVGRKARCSCGNIMVLAEPPEAESSGASAAPGGKHSAAPLEEKMCPQCGMVYSKDKPHNCEQRTCPTCGKWYWSSRPHTCTAEQTAAGTEEQTAAEKAFREVRQNFPAGTVNVSPRAKLWPRWKCASCGGWVLLDPVTWPAIVCALGVIELGVSLYLANVATGPAFQRRLLAERGEWYGPEEEALAELPYVPQRTAGLGAAVGAAAAAGLALAAGSLTVPAAIGLIAAGVPVGAFVSAMVSDYRFSAGPEAQDGRSELRAVDWAALETGAWALLVFSSALLVSGLMLLAAHAPYLCTSCGERIRRPSGQANLPE